MSMLVGVKDSMLADTCETFKSRQRCERTGSTDTCEIFISSIKTEVRKDDLNPLGRFPHCCMLRGHADSANSANLV